MTWRNEPYGAELAFKDGNVWIPARHLRSNDETGEAEAQWPPASTYEVDAEGQPTGDVPRVILKSQDWIKVV
ncbi:MAG: hypothetical protein ACYDGR_14560 [Candidatus Dormibacteria bacterium]